MNNQANRNSDQDDEVDSSGLIKKSNDESNKQNSGTTPENDKLTVRIKTMDEREHKIEVTLDEKVSDLKNKIRDQMSVPLDKQRLIFLGRQLKDDQTMKESRIKDDVCILLVANRSQNQNEAQRQPAERNDQAAGDVDFPSFIFNALNETAQMRRNRRLLFQQNARSFLRNIRLNVNQSRETIIQNLTSTELLLNSVKDIEEVKNTEPNSDNSLD